MRPILEAFDRRFQTLFDETRELVKIIPADRLYWQPRQTEALFPVNSCGEYILRSAAAVESTFGGITARLWDDPFEWTLPEAIHNNQLMLDYLDEVEETRVRGFALLDDDTVLTRLIPAPEKLTPVIDILLSSITRSEHFFGRACAVFRVFDDGRLPRR